MAFSRMSNGERGFARPRTRQRERTAMRAFISRRLHPRRRAYSCGRTRCDVAALDKGTNYEMASRNCISTNFGALLRSRQHPARRYGWNAARVWCTHVWRTRVWWTRVTRVTRLSWLWWTRVTCVTRLSWLSWTRVRWPHGWCNAAPLAGRDVFLPLAFSCPLFLPLTSGL